MHTGTTMANFGSLRSLLHAPPTKTTWALLCSQLVKFSARQLEHEIVPYLLDHFSRAPSLHRPLPRAWARMFARTLPSPSLLHTVDDLTILETHADRHTIVALTQHLRAHIERLSPRRIEIQGDVGPSQDVLALLASAPRDHLTHVALRQTPYLSGRVHELIAALPETTTSLELHQRDLEDASILRHMLARLPHLRHLSLELPLDSTTAVEIVAMLGDDLRHRLIGLELLGATRLQAGRALPIHSFEMLGTSRQTHIFEREWPRLQKLTLVNWEVPSSHSSAVGGRTFQLPSLRHFALEGGFASDASLLGLLDALQDSPITSLRLAATDTTRQSLHAITSSRGLRDRLTHLSLAHNRHELTADDQQLLFATHRWEALRTLHLGHVDLQARRSGLFEDDLGHPTFPHLEKLTLSSCKLSPELFYSLCRSELPSLHTALLQGSVISAKTPDFTSTTLRNRQLLSASWLEELEHLYMPNISFTKGAIETLCAMPFSRLRRLSFDGLHIDELLPGMRHASWLEHLHLLEPDTPDMPHHDLRITRPYLELIER